MTRKLIAAALIAVEWWFVTMAFAFIVFVIIDTLPR